MANWMTATINIDTTVPTEKVGTLIEFADQTPPFCLISRNQKYLKMSAKEVVRDMGYSKEQINNMRQPAGISVHTKKKAHNWLESNAPKFNYIKRFKQDICDKFDCHPDLKEQVVLFCIHDLSPQEVINLTADEWARKAQEFTDTYLSHIEKNPEPNDLAGKLYQSNLDDEFSRKVSDYLRFIRMVDRTTALMQDILND